MSILFTRTNNDRYESNHNSNIINRINNKFTFSFWSNLPTFTTGDTFEYIFTKVGGSQNVWYTLLINSSSQFEFGIPTSLTSFTEEVRWLIPSYRNAIHQYVGTFDGDESVDKIKLYIDGNLVTPASTGGTLPSTTTDGTVPVSIGNGWGGGQSGRAFEGVLKEVGIWNQVLSLDEIKALSNYIPLEVNLKNLVSYWPLTAALGKDRLYEPLLQETVITSGNPLITKDTKPLIEQFLTA